MSAATLNLSVVEKRMMTEIEAASYCGIPARHFKTTCPVLPVALAAKVQRYDKRDLDAWIDISKTGIEDHTREAILARL